MRRPVRNETSARTQRRTGMVLVAGMLCLLVATMVAGSIVRLVVRNDRVVRANHARLQAEWLAEAGLQRGLAAIRRTDAYDGETWNVPATDLVGDAAGRVVVEVNRDPVAGDWLSATAIYPVGVQSRATSERWIPLPKTESATDAPAAEESDDD